VIDACLLFSVRAGKAEPRLMFFVRSALAVPAEVDSNTYFFLLRGKKLTRSSSGATARAQTN
jgi:hypothetical protein